MATARKPARKRARLPQCAFTEGPYRCPRDATATSPLCRAHEVAASVAAAQNSQTGRHFFERGRDLLDRFLGGHKVTRDDIIDVAREGARVAVNEYGSPWGFGGNYAQYQPPGQGPEPRFEEEAPPRPDPARARARRPPPPQPPPGPSAAEITRARAVFGWGPADVFTRETLKRRFRELAKKHHPDRGGNPRRMQEISAANDLLEATIPRR